MSKNLLIAALLSTAAAVSFAQTPAAAPAAPATTTTAAPAAKVADTAATPAKKHVKKHGKKKAVKAEAASK